ncbi:MAG: hypothetical protein JJU29_20080 [Verrucomicrobia bacterium]|nr:hypothetical protein [Verrucomicrobiota bacterium]MCH8513543.1 hypothetical protein [Kiritimatiellia bacterium]
MNSHQFKYFWYRLCPHCSGQGRLLITEDLTNERLYLHCEECDWGWIDPAMAHDVSKGFLTILEDFETKNPTFETIRSFGWEKYALHAFHETSES